MDNIPTMAEVTEAFLNAMANERVDTPENPFFKVGDLVKYTPEAVRDFGGSLCEVVEKFRFEVVAIIPDCAGGVDYHFKFPEMVHEGFYGSGYRYEKA